MSERSAVARLVRGPVSAGRSARAEVVTRNVEGGSIVSSSTTPKDGDGAGEKARALGWRGSVTVHRNEIYVEVDDADSLDLVDRALIHALLEAGTAAEKEGPHVTTAVSPALCYGKVRVSPRSEEHLRTHLELARRAALGVLTAAHIELK